MKIFLLSLVLFLFSGCAYLEPPKPVTKEEILKDAQNLSQKQKSELKVVFDRFELGEKPTLYETDKIQTDEKNMEYLEFTPLYFTTGRVFLGKEKKIVKIEVVKLPPKGIAAKYSSYMFTVLNSIEKKFGKSDFVDYQNGFIYYKRFTKEEDFIKEYLKIREPELTDPKEKGDVSKLEKLSISDTIGSVVIKANKYAVTLTYNTQEYIDGINAFKENNTTK